MENKEEKVVTKTSGGVKALLVILILALIGTSGFIVYDKLISKNNESKSNTKEETKKEETKKEEKKESVKKIDESKEYVYDLETGESYAIPYINIDSDDAKKMNEDIKVFSEKFGDKSSEYYRLKYYYYTNKNIISVALVFYYDANGLTNSLILNIDKETGKKVSNEEILKAKNINIEELRNKAIEVYESLPTIENDKKFVGHYNDDEKEEYNGMTVYEVNKKKFEKMEIDELEIFLNSNNELCAYVGVYLSAGPSGMKEFYNLDTKQKEILK